MKKITLVLCALLLTAGVTKAGEYVAYQPSAPVAISWDNSSWAGVQLDFGDNAYKGDIFFPTLSGGDKVKIHITNIATGAATSVQFRDGDGYWVDMPGVTEDLNNGVIWFTIQGGSVNYTVKDKEKNLDEERNLTFTANEMAEWIKNRGLIIKGIRYKVLDITVQSDDVEDDGSYITTLKESYEFTGWSSTNLIDAGIKYTSGDYITVTVALKDNTKSGKVQFQVKHDSWPMITDGQVWMNPGDKEDTFTINIKDADLADIQTHGLAMGGENTKVTNVQYHYTPAKAGYRPVYIPASGYATFCGASTCALPVGVNAYYVSSIADGNKAMTTQLSNIPASHGVILEGVEGIYQLYTTTDEAAAVTANLLAGVTTRTQITDVTNKYVLYNNSGTPEFRKINAGTNLDPFKAYLNAAGAEARIALSFDNETNGIDELKQQTAGSKQMFDLQGRRVAKSTRGLYIVNGKKVFVK